MPPSTAPASNDFSAAAQRHAPQSAPVMMRAVNGAGAVRFDIIGSLSAMSSPIASTENIATAVVDPMKATGEP